MSRSIYKISLVVFLLSGLLYACSKYKDPAPQSTAQLTNLYCNDPDGINYNWGFPGTPDNSVCIYATNEMQGTWLLKDSVVAEASGLLLAADSFNIYINPVNGSKKKMTIAGFCSSGSLLATANRILVASVDTTVGDSLTFNKGQLFCRQQDTVTGTFSRDPIDNLLMHVSLRIKNDTGVLILVGDARKQ